MGRRIASLAPAPGGGPADGGLGYRGLLVRTSPDEADAAITVSGGLVTVRRPDDPPRHLRDPGRALERWLLAEGGPHLPPEVLTAVRRNLG
ncbi:hypothetical protein [Kitasatospora sp. NPDC094011]|uniref:hypothetical protein n=1 Tax=Kitasatospora sp. NPDC094011 TaxID=3364090 RepID=UPI003817FA3D